MTFIKLIGFTLLFIVNFQHVVKAQILECSYSDCYFKKSLQSLEDEQTPIDLSLYSTDYLNKVESITFDYASIYQLTSHLLTQVRNVNAISATKAGIKKINRGLFGAENGNGGNLKHLLLSNNVMERVDNSTFKGARQLEMLDLSYNMIVILEADAFKGLHELSILNLAHNLLTQIDTNLFLQTEVLYNLDLSENLLESFNFDMFTNIKRYQFVALKSNKIREIIATEINHSVVVLDLSSNPLEDEDTEALSKLKNVISLRKASSENFGSYEYQSILNLSFYNSLLQKGSVNTPKEELCISPKLRSKKSNWPWLVTVYLKHLGTYHFKCDGNLISTRVVISSFTCIFREYLMLHPDNVLILLGRTDPTGTTTQAVQKFVLPHDFSTFPDNTHDPDFVLIVMKKPVVIGQHIRPICLSDYDFNNRRLYSETGLLIGWDSVAVNKSTTLNFLPHINTVSVVTNKTCLRWNKITNGFCSAKVKTQSSCTISTGGGLMMASDSGWGLRAIVSTSMYDADTLKCDSFSFTDLTQSREWIQRMLIRQNPLPLTSELLTGGVH